MLMVSVGLVKAGVTITVPNGETATITLSPKSGTTPVVTVSSIGTIEGKNNVYSIAANTSADQTVTISSLQGGVAITGGKASSVVVDDSNNVITEVSASNVGLKSLAFTNATGLKKLDISGNKELTSITGTLSVIEDINASNCGFTTWQNAFTSATVKKLNLSGNQFGRDVELSFRTAFSALEELYLSNCNLSHENKLTVSSTLKKLDVSGNHLRYITGDERDGRDFRDTDLYGSSFIYGRCQ